jgi:hypothetical protein
MNKKRTQGPVSRAEARTLIYSTLGGVESVPGRHLRSRYGMAVWIRGQAVARPRVRHPPIRVTIRA